MFLWRVGFDLLPFHASFALRVPISSPINTTLPFDSGHIEKSRESGVSFGELMSEIEWRERENEKRVKVRIELN